MPIDTTPSAVATSALQAIPFSSLIGGPLDAAIQAQAMAAKTSWEFIQQVGLNTDPETGQKSAVNVSFYYNKGGKLTKLIVPLLTIVPIPYIAIDDIQINFKANISASSSSVTSNSESTDFSAGGSAKASFGIGPFSVSATFNANYSSKKDSKASSESKYSVEYTMDLAVHAGQSDMPTGLATVLNILQSSITDTGVGGSISLSPSNQQINLADYTVGSSITVPVGVTVTNDEGLLLANTNVTLACDNNITAPAAAATDNNGYVLFNISIPVAASGMPSLVNLTVTADGLSGVSGTGSIALIGEPQP